MKARIEAETQSIQQDLKRRLLIFTGAGISALVIGGGVGWVVGQKMAPYESPQLPEVTQDTNVEGAKIIRYICGRQAGAVERESNRRYAVLELPKGSSRVIQRAIDSLGECR